MAPKEASVPATRRTASVNGRKGFRTKPVPLILWLEDCGLGKIARVGGKGANLGEMVGAGLAVPPGFVVTKEAYETFVTHSGIWNQILALVAQIDGEDMRQVSEVGRTVRGLIEGHPLPPGVVESIRASYIQRAGRAGGG